MSQHKILPSFPIICKVNYPYFQHVDPFSTRNKVFIGIRAVDQFKFFQHFQLFVELGICKYINFPFLEIFFQP